MWRIASGTDDEGVKYMLPLICYIEKRLVKDYKTMEKVIFITSSEKREVGENCERVGHFFFLKVS